MLRLALDVARADVLVRHHARGGVEGGEEHHAGRTDVVESTARAKHRAQGQKAFPPLHMSTVTLAASPDAGLCIIEGIWIRAALSRTFTCENGQ